MKHTLAGVLIALCGAAVLASWYGLLPEWLRIGAGQVSMKAVTAGGFVHVGLLLVALAEERRQPTARSFAALLALAVSMVAVSACLLYGSLTGHPCPLVAWLPGEAVSAMTTIPGTPSLGTAFAFMLLALGGLSGCLRRLWWACSLSGGLVMAVGIIALIGWGLRLPSLYWFAGPNASAMALPTASLFIAAGALMVLIGASWHQDEREKAAE